MPARKAVPLLCALAVAESDAAPPRFFPSAPLAGTALPFSEAVQVGHLLFVSGQIGNVPGRLELVPGGVAAEARQALANVRSVLERHASSLENVVKCTIFLAEIQEWGAFNEVFREFFSRCLPARSALAGSGLALGARVEVECVAFVPAAGA